MYKCRDVSRTQFLEKISKSYRYKRITEYIDNTTMLFATQSHNYRQVLFNAKINRSPWTIINQMSGRDPAFTGVASL